MNNYRFLHNSQLLKCFLIVVSASRPFNNEQISDKKFRGGRGGGGKPLPAEKSLSPWITTGETAITIGAY